MNRNEKMARKKRNRVRLVQLIFVSTLLYFARGYYAKFYDKLSDRIIQTKKEESLLSLGSLIREEGFYNNKIYAEKYSLLKKEWNNQSAGGIVYNEHGRETE